MIDYEAIHNEASADVKYYESGYGYVKAIIEVYERQKKAVPEWVPLDLATVQQGQEVRISTWDISVNPHRFVATYRNETIVEAGGNLHRYKKDNHSWLMRAPKPKTVRVWVHKHGDNVYSAGTNDAKLGKLVGEGDIEVLE